MGPLSCLRVCRDKDLVATAQRIVGTVWRSTCSAASNMPHTVCASWSIHLKCTGLPCKLRAMLKLVVQLTYACDLPLPNQAGLHLTTAWLPAAANVAITGTASGLAHVEYNQGQCSVQVRAMLPTWLQQAGHIYDHLTLPGLHLPVVLKVSQHAHR